MFLPCLRSIAIAAVAVVTFGSTAATDLSASFAQYEALTVTSEVQVEALAGAIAAIPDEAAKLQVNNSFQEFLAAYNADVAAGTLTVSGHNKRIDDFLQSVDAVVPDFATTGDAEIAKAVVDYFKFLPNAHAASWDVLNYGASAAQAQLANPTVSDLLLTIDAYMKENIGTASTSELQAQCDGFVAQAEAAAPGFRDLMYNAISGLYTSLWNQESAEAPNDGSETDDTLVGSEGDDGSGATGSDEAGVPSGSGDSSSSTPSPTPTSETDGNNVPSPAPTSSADAIATVSSATIAAVALAYMMVLL